MQPSARFVFGGRPPCLGFCSDSFWKDVAPPPPTVQLRKWDEAAKELHMDMPSLDYYRPVMVKHLQEQQRAQVA